MPPPILGLLLQGERQAASGNRSQTGHAGDKAIPRSSGELAGLGPVRATIMTEGVSRPDRRRLDWKQPGHYAALANADRSIFAWEWLRRTGTYRLAWQRHRADSGALAPHPREFGLEQFEDPDLGAPQARPVWCSAIDPAVIRATVQSDLAPPEDSIDLLQWPELVTVAIDDDQSEHLLLSNGERALRIDVIEGTLIGCPAALGYFLHGIQALPAPLSALDQLRMLRRTGQLASRSRRSSGLQRRWILELRVADALLAGADQQEIARALFGAAVAPQRWRIASAAYRRRVQRLVLRARQSLDAPLDRQWFEPLCSLGETISASESRAGGAKRCIRADERGTDRQ